ncbi:hypothetical protein TNCV_332351 [Trichonephila clavipes]|nr:hypothetical protein TNCV_332351 [Trichonephila clavipes]
MGRTILLERRQSESVGRRNSRTTFLRSDWPRPFARREVGVEMELGRSPQILPECLEDCSGGPDSQTWERSHVSGIPPTYFLTPYPK